jgi:hypothetical protein
MFLLLYLLIFYTTIARKLQQGGQKRRKETGRWQGRWMTGTTTNGTRDVHDVWKVSMTKTGPNDARRVVWANSKYFFFAFSLLTLNITYRYNF